MGTGRSPHPAPGKARAGVGVILTWLASKLRVFSLGRPIRPLRQCVSFLGLVVFFSGLFFCAL
jgi:hypothetical protein